MRAQLYFLFIQNICISDLYNSCIGLFVVKKLTFIKTICKTVRFCRRGYNILCLVQNLILTCFIKTLISKLEIQMDTDVIWPRVLDMHHFS